MQLAGFMQQQSFKLFLQAQILMFTSSAMSQESYLVEQMEYMPQVVLKSVLQVWKSSR